MTTFKGQVLIGSKMRKWVEIWGKGKFGEIIRMSIGEYKGGGLLQKGKRKMASWEEFETKKAGEGITWLQNPFCLPQLI